VPGPITRIFAGISFFLLTCVIAIAGYLAAGWNLDDSIYMVVITIFGVGYGEVNPIESPQLRALTIGVIVAGYGAVIYTVGGFVQMVIDGEINRALGARRMTKGIERMNGHTIICGFGRIGRILAAELAEAKMPFIIVDMDPLEIKEAEESGYLVVNGNATEEEILERAGISRATTLATVLSDDATNLFITITARDINPQLEIIARGEHPSTEKKLLRCGASKVVMPAAIGAQRLANLITRPSAENLLEASQLHSGLNDELGAIGLHLDELKLPAGSPLIGKTVGDIEVRGNQGFLIVAIRSASGKAVLNPDTDVRLNAGDTVIVIGHGDDLPQLATRYTLTREVTYRGVAVQR